MFFHQLKSKGSTLSYLVGCEASGEAVAVDVVAYDEAWFLERAMEEGAKITHVIDTHIHPDHYSGGRELAERAGAVYCLHESNRGTVEYAFEPLAGRQQLRFGDVTVEVRHTPGHSEDSICLLVSDRRRGGQPWFVLTGDTLLVGAVGRPDLGGDEREMAGRLFDSLHQQLLALPDETEIFPGHFAGSICGMGLSGKPCSTVGFERRFNPVLGIADREAFIDHVLQKLPPRTDCMDQYMAANLAA